MSEEMLIRHCAPTLAGIKTGNMFSCPYRSREEIHDEVRRLNRVLAPKGVRVLPLRYFKQRALIYLYRPSSLSRDLADGYASDLLKQYGYSLENPQRCVVQLVHRLRTCPGFPHEIGLFLLTYCFLAIRRRMFRASSKTGPATANALDAGKFTAMKKRQGRPLTGIKSVQRFILTSGQRE